MRKTLISSASHPIAFLHGLWDGAMRLAIIDPETGKLTSASISKALYQFHAYCHKEMVTLETTVAPLYSEALLLLKELDEFETTSFSINAPDNAFIPHPKTIEDAQKNRAIEATAEEAAKRYRDIICRLANILEKMTTTEHLCYENLGVAANSLQAQFCSYAAGVSRPIRSVNIPDVVYDHHFQNYATFYSDVKAKIELAKEI